MSVKICWQQLVKNTVTFDPKVLLQGSAPIQVLSASSCDGFYTDIILRPWHQSTTVGKNVVQGGV